MHPGFDFGGLSLVTWVFMHSADIFVVLTWQMDPCHEAFMAFV